MCMGANLFYFDCIYSVCLPCSDHYPSPQGPSTISIELGGGGHRVGGKGGGLLVDERPFSKRALF